MTGIPLRQRAVVVTMRMICVVVIDSGDLLDMRCRCPRADAFSIVVCCLLMCRADMLSVAHGKQVTLI